MFLDSRTFCLIRSIVFINRRTLFCYSAMELFSDYFFVFRQCDIMFLSRKAVDPPRKIHQAFGLVQCCWVADAQCVRIVNCNMVLFFCCLVFELDHHCNSNVELRSEFQVMLYRRIWASFFSEFLVLKLWD